MKTPALLIALAACGQHKGSEDPAPTAHLEVTSTMFANGAEIPVAFTCEGLDAQPTLSWSGAPEGTKAYAVIVDDPDAPDPAAPKQTWVHLVAMTTGTSLVTGATIGTNDFGKTVYNGPCPPVGRHRYFFKVYALDTVIDQAGITKDALLEAMKGHILAQGELMGTYQKKRP